MHVWTIATRNLLGERGRLAITVGGVAFSVILILVLVGLYQGWNRQMTRFLGSLDADLWVGQQGSRDMSHAISLLPATTNQQLTTINGVQGVTSFLGRQVNFETENGEAILMLVGVDPSSPIRPFNIVEGSFTPNFGEIIVDKVFAQKENLGIGDTVTINNKTLTIAGISSGGHILIYSYAFGAMEDVRSILNLTNITNYFLVKTDDPVATKSAIERALPNVFVRDRQTFLDDNAAIVSETFLPIIGVLVLIALAIGITVIGLTIYTATVEKRREYGVLKAIGYTNSQLFRIALGQSLVAGIIGFVVGNILILGVVWLAQSAVPGFQYEVGWKEIAATGVVTLAMASLAALIPLKRLMSIDPAEVFKA